MKRIKKKKNFINYSSPFFFLILYGIGLFLGGLLYYFNQDKFNINPLVLQSGKNKIEQEGQKLINEIEKRYHELGVYIEIVKPQKWIIDENQYASKISLMYKRRYENDPNENRMDGLLLIYEDASNPALTKVRPGEAGENTEELIINFNLNNFIQLIANGYLSENISYLTCVYFSFLTFITVSYGDIVPITKMGQLIVSVQLIFGIIMSALFLQSILNIVFKQRRSVES